MKEALEALEAFSFDLYPLKGEYAEKTIETTVRNNITIYDASYISLTILRNVCMYTADEKLIERLGRNYLKYIIRIGDV